VGVVLELQEQEGVTQMMKYISLIISLPYGCGCENCHIS
jgi:hypothetical protein